jgi:hypothetical protein
VKRAYVVTVGCKRESLGALKLAVWLRGQGWEVIECTALDWKDAPADLYCFSVVFSWKLPEMVVMAKFALTRGEVWIGGPAVTFSAANRRYVEQETGIKPHTGIDHRFEQVEGSFPMVYFSRGCPAYTPACGTCPVPFIEGNKFTFYRDSQPAKLLLDNNLSALPVEYQQYIIERYLGSWQKKQGLVDANSGFEPHTFTEATLLRWKQFPLQCWRFGYDDLTERDQALEMMRLLKAHGYSGEKVRVYTLIGNEPIDACVLRMTEVIEHGMHPWPQRLRPLDWLGPEGTLPCRYDWDEPTLIAYQRFYSYRAFWARLKPEEFYYQGRYPLRRSQ